MKEGTIGKSVMPRFSNLTECHILQDRQPSRDLHDVDYSHWNWYKNSGRSDASQL